MPSSRRTGLPNLSSPSVSRTVDDGSQPKLDRASTLSYLQAAYDSGALFPQELLSSVSGVFSDSEYSPVSSRGGGIHNALVHPFPPLLSHNSENRCGCNNIICIFFHGASPKLKMKPVSSSLASRIFVAMDFRSFFIEGRKSLHTEGLEPILIGELLSKMHAELHRPIHTAEFQKIESIPDEDVRYKMARSMRAHFISRTGTRPEVGQVQLVDYLERDKGEETMYLARLVGFGPEFRIDFC